MSDMPKSPTDHPLNAVCHLWDGQQLILTGPKYLHDSYCRIVSTDSRWTPYRYGRWNGETMEAYSLSVRIADTAVIEQELHGDNPKNVVDIYQAMASTKRLSADEPPLRMLIVTTAGVYTFAVVKGGLSYQRYDRDQPVVLGPHHEFASFYLMASMKAAKPVIPELVGLAGCHGLSESRQTLQVRRHRPGFNPVNFVDVHPSDVIRLAFAGMRPSKKQLELWNAPYETSDPFYSQVQELLKHT